MPLLLITSIIFFTMSSLDMFGVSFANTGLVLGFSDLVAIVFLLFSGFGVMPGAQFGLNHPDPLGGSVHDTFLFCEALYLFDCTA